MKNIELNELMFISNKVEISNKLRNYLKEGKPLFKASHVKNLDLFDEVRQLYYSGHINLNNKTDLYLIKETNIGLYLTENGKKYTLDYPVKKGKDVVVYSLNENQNIVESKYNETIFKMLLEITIDKKNYNTHDVLSNIRAIKGITTVNVEDVNSNYDDEDDKHKITISVKIDPNPYNKIGNPMFLEIVKDITKIAGILSVSKKGSIKKTRR